MTIQRLHHVQITYPPDREADARAFYCTLLGFAEIPKPDSLRHRGGFWVTLADQQIHLSPEADIDRRATKAHVAYQVDDLAAWREQLTAAGVTITESIPIPGYRRLECRDPFGNRLELIQPDPMDG
jgi:catechol 2,3-dioxygenase-like lactoylglutathione lyase family enzyme